MMGVSLSAGGCMDWFRQALCPAEAAAEKQGGGDTFARLDRAAKKVPPGSQGLFFLPYLSGERTPHADPQARGALVGLTLAHGRGHVVRAVLEGVAYALRDSLAIIRDLGVPVRQVRATGGGGKSALWRQIQADVFGQEVCRINTDQGPAYGVALLAAVGAGYYKDVEEVCAAVVRVVSRTPVDPSAQAVYDRAFPEYQQLYRSLKDDFQRIADLDRAAAAG
jgi:xylulokinase